jgi:hypothetical protein
VLGPVLMLGLLLLVVFVLWLNAAHAIWAATLGPQTYDSPLALLRDCLTTAPGRQMLVLGTATGFLFAALVLCIGMVSFPMLIDRRGHRRRGLRPEPGPGRDCGRNGGHRGLICQSAQARLRGIMERVWQAAQQVLPKRIGLPALAWVSWDLTSCAYRARPYHRPLTVISLRQSGSKNR